MLIVPMPREIDVLVAEHVMGWTPRGSHPIFRTLVFAAGASDTLLPNFSTDIAAAWTVVDALSKRFRRVEVYVLDEGAVCLIEDGASEIEEGYIADADSETTPMAICLAALQAVGVDAPKPERRNEVEATC
jgi:hypothetical protein